MGSNVENASSWALVRVLRVSLLFALLACVLTYPQIAEIAKGLPCDSGGRPVDDALLNCWILAWTPHAIATGKPVFDTNLFYPRKNTLAYSEHMFGNFPFAAPVYWATHNPILAHNVVLLLTFVLSGLGMFLLVFELTGRGYPAIASAVVFAFCSFRFSEYAHVQVLSAHWMPFCLLFIVRLARRATAARWFGAFAFGFAQGMCCSYYAIYFLTYLMLFSACVCVIARSKRTIVALATVVITIGGALYPFYRPYLELRQELGFLRPVGENVRNSADLVGYIAPRAGSFLYGALRSYLPGHEGPDLFAGFGALALAVAGLWQIRKRAPFRGVLLGFVCAGVAALLFSLGPYVRLGGVRMCRGPYWLLYSFAPGYDGLRAPSRFAMLAMLSLAVLCGVGLDNILRRLRTRVALRTAGLLACAFLILESTEVPLAFAEPAYGENIPPVYRWVRSLPDDTVIVELPLDLQFFDNLYGFYSTYHWKRLVNGRSGFSPPEDIAKFLTFIRFPAPAAVRMARTLGVSYAIVHAELIPVPVSAMLRSPGVRLVKSFGRDYVLEVLPGPQTKSPEKRRMHPVSLRNAKMSCRPNKSAAKLACDGDPNTVWSTGRNQRKGDFFAVDLGQPRRLGMVRVQFGRRPFALPRYFCLTTRPGGRPITGAVVRNEFFESVYRSALSSPKDVWGEIRFPTIQSQTLCIELFQDMPSFEWSMAEIEVYEVENGSE